MSSFVSLFVIVLLIQLFQLASLLQELLSVSQAVGLQRVIIPSPHLAFHAISAPSASVGGTLSTIFPAPKLVSSVFLCYCLNQPKKAIQSQTSWDPRQQSLGPPSPVCMWNIPKLRDSEITLLHLTAVSTISSPPFPGCGCPHAASVMCSFLSLPFHCNPCNRQLCFPVSSWWPQSLLP